VANLALNFSKETYHGGHKGIFGPVRSVQDIYGSRAEFRSMIRFLGPSKSSTPEYEAKVRGILEEVRAEIDAYRNRLEIQNGVTNAGCDAMLSDVFYGQMTVGEKTYEVFQLGGKDRREIASYIHKTCPPHWYEVSNVNYLISGRNFWE